MNQSLAKFDLPNIPSVTNGSLIAGSSHHDFFRLLAEHGETLSEVRRKELFLRALECKPFTRSTIPGTLPCHSIGRLPLSRGLTLDYLVKFAEVRLDAQPDHAFRLADLGLVQGTLPQPGPYWRDQRYFRTRASKQEDRSVVDQMALALSGIRQHSPPVLPPRSGE